MSRSMSSKCQLFDVLAADMSGAGWRLLLANTTLFRQAYNLSVVLALSDLESLRHLGGHSI